MEVGGTHISFRGEEVALITHLSTRNNGSEKTMNTIFKLLKQKKISTPNSISTKISFKNEFEIDISIQNLRIFAASRSALKETPERVPQEQRK